MIHAPPSAAESLRANQEGTLPGLLGFNWTLSGKGVVAGRFEVKEHHLAPTGFLHAATVVALADTACGYGRIMALFRCTQILLYPDA